MNDTDRTRVDSSHPRYESLSKRERLVEGFRSGIVVPQGLIAHGRGEMFDYLLGEETLPSAEKAERAAAAHLILAKNPVISVNGNLAALCPEKIVQLADATHATIEVNLFHWSDDRARRIREILEAHGARNVLAENPDRILKGVSHNRGRCHSKGIFSADVVLVPLEDGDRATALTDMKKTVISLDLNPMSRTSRSASVSVVDEASRALPNMIRFARALKKDTDQAAQTIESFENSANLREIFPFIAGRLETLAER